MEVARNYYTAKEVAEMLGICVSSAYKVIRQLNTELNDKGYITVTGKVSRAYFDEKVYKGASA